VSVKLICNVLIVVSPISKSRHFSKKKDNMKVVLEGDAKDDRLGTILKITGDRTPSTTSSSGSTAPSRSSSVTNDVGKACHIPEHATGVPAFHVQSAQLCNEAAKDTFLDTNPSIFSTQGIGLTSRLSALSLDVLGENIPSEKPLSAWKKVRLLLTHGSCGLSFKHHARGHPVPSKAVLIPVKKKGQQGKVRVVSKVACSRLSNSWDNRSLCCWLC